ncbi:MAG: hypothetical protein PV354_10965, partial [Bartonella sp.]|nr:hypothetical protein [Bartonella sp.]
LLDNKFFEKKRAEFRVKAESHYFKHAAIFIDQPNLPTNEVFLYTKNPPEKAIQIHKHHYTESQFDILPSKNSLKNKEKINNHHQKDDRTTYWR